MTTNLQSVKQNPDLILDDMRRMAQKINELVAVTNRGYSEHKQKTITSSSTADNTATVILADATTGNIVFTLPPVITNGDRYYNIVKIDSSTHSVSAATGSSLERFNGSTSQSTTTQYGVLRPFSNGSTNWYGI